MQRFTVGDYLLARLKEIGIGHLFGVPGDYNLQFLDRVIAHPEIGWVGCANELNAAYAADGYARCRGAAALLTTFGVGELSAINGLAGSYAEYVPVIHIVGAPASAAQKQGDCVHHSLGDGDFGHFLRMAGEVTAASAQLSAGNATAEIDRVIATMMREKRPGYLMLAVDVAEAEVAPPVAPLDAVPRLSSEQARHAFRAAAEQHLAQAHKVALLADFLAARWQQQATLARLRQLRAIPCATLLMGKGVLDEQLPGYVGTYAAAGSESGVCELIEQTDATICVGVRFTDTLTAGFTQDLPTEQVIDIQPFAASVAGKSFAPLTMADALEELEAIFSRYGENWALAPASAPLSLSEADSHISQRTFWQAMQAFLQSGDCILAEQGTAAFGAASLRLPSGAQLLVQPLWGSIGYTLPAAFGALTAAPERRVILIIGDGSAQLTIQELGSMLRDGLKPLIFLLNNDGYTVERAIHGATQRYNDIAQWNWTALPHALALDGQAQSWRVVESVQLQEVLARLQTPSCLTLVEVAMQKEDIPPLLRKVCTCLAQRNGG